MSGLGKQPHRLADSDRWLASRFAPPPQREWLAAIAALALEFSRIPRLVSQAPAAAIRLRWWLEQIETMLAGQAPAPHPLTLELRAPLATGLLPLELFGEMAEARLREYEPITVWAVLEDYLDCTAGALARLSAAICLGQSDVSPDQASALRSAGRAWGLLELVRTPRPAFATFSSATLEAHALEQYQEVRRLASALPAEAFPAVAPVALIPAYVRHGGRLSLLGRQVRLILAAARGEL